MPQIKRPKIIIGNWKMYKTIAEAKTFIKDLAVQIKGRAPQVGLAVPFTMISAAVEAARGTPIAIGAQNMNDAEEGAFTGEISCRMLIDTGAAFVILGHSERRRLFHEDDALVNKKLKRALNEKLKSIVCIGETLEQHQKGEVQKVLSSQLKGSLHGISPDQLKDVVIAYEPVWAIGTNQTATPDIAQKAQHFCREVVAENLGRDAADHLVIQYGGSVKPDNAKALLEQPDIDGLLVGGASLSVDSFAKIINFNH